MRLPRLGFRLHLVLCLLAIAALPAWSDDPGTEQAELLEFATEFTHDDLKRPASVSISPDNKFLYTAGYMQQPTCLVLRHDRENNSIDFVQSITDADRLQGTTSIRLSNDGRYAVTASFASGVTLFRRDPESGELTLLGQQAQR